MAANIREEIRRLQRRKQLHFHPQTSSGDSSDMEGPSSPSGPSGSSLTPFSHNTSGKEKPLFTFRQVKSFDYLHSSTGNMWILLFVGIISLEIKVDYRDIKIL